MTLSLTDSVTQSLTFTFDIQRAILETCDHWDIWSDRFLESFQICWKFLWPYTLHLRHWLHFWQLRITILTFTLWPLNKEWRGQHSQFLRRFFGHVMSSDHSEQMSQRSQVSRMALRRCSQNVFVFVFVIVIVFVFFFVNFLHRWNHSNFCSQNVKILSKF